MQSWVNYSRLPEHLDALARAGAVRPPYAEHMLVSHRHRFIFVKTKKTGSSTTELWLKRYCPPDDSLMSPHRVGRGAPGRNHASAQEIHDVVGAEMWRDYLTIANVRNPWDKMVSLLFYRPARTARFDSGELDITSMDQARRRLERLAATFRRSPCDAILEPGSPPIDRIIPLDRIEHDLQLIAAELGLPDRGQSLTRQKSLTRPEWARDWRPLYTDAAIESVARSYSDWIEAFGYRFDSREATR